MADGVKKINEWIMKEGRVIGITKDISAEKFEGGTFFVHPNEGFLKYNNVDNSGRKSWQKFLPIKIFDDKTIKRSLIDDKAINTSKLEDSAVTTIKIANDSISDVKLKRNSVTTEKIHDLHVTTEKINNFAVNEYKILNGAVVTDKIRDLAVTSDKIRNLNVLNGHIAEGTIKNSKLFNKTITHEKIADLTIKTALLADGAVTEKKIGDSEVKGKHLDSLIVATRHIIDRNVTGIKIAKNSLKDEHMINNSINADKLIDGTITTSKYDSLSITGAKIANTTIDMTKLDTSVQTLINESIRVEGANNTATVRGNLKVNGNIEATGNITGAKVYNPVFADIAEAYIPTTELEVGQAVCLTEDGGLKVEALNKYNVNRFLGFISNQYAACYGATPEQIESKELVAVALTGRIPVKMNTTHEDAKVGSFIGIENGELVPYRQCAGYYSKPVTSVGKIIDIIDNKTALVQI